MRKPEPVKLVAIALPILVEVVAVTLFLAAAFVGISLWAGA